MYNPFYVRYLLFNIYNDVLFLLSAYSFLNKNKNSDVLIL